MKIAILTSGILPVPAVRGGAVENLIDFYLAYNDQHQLHDITVFSVYHPNVRKSPNIKSTSNYYVYIKKHSIWARLRAKFYGKMHPNEYYHYQLEYFFEQAYKKLAKHHYDLIILENRPGYAIKLKERLNTPIISHIHTDIVNIDLPRAVEVIKANEGFICVSEYIKKRILDIGLPTKAMVVYNGLDEKKFSHVSKCISRQALGFNNDDFVVIYTGRIVPAKGVKELIQAIQLLQDESDIKLLVVGGNNYADSVSNNLYLDELHTMGQKMEDKVFFTGFVPYEQLPAYLSLADVAVMPSQINEALGMSSIEATAIGLPVIATNDGGLPETLTGQKHIIIDKAGNIPLQIAEAIILIKEHYTDYTGNQLNPQFTKETYAESFFKSISNYGIR
ncbi:glycosyltransferase family 4 protein [Prevotella communis]|uniref:glycosyltransferase family 4 protein n=1 Tax=Prevotella communis TaxID=2913614 RepID=UPI001EDC74B7|nr:glycosyltransferase family 4 protein [Prevotella communis]UKK55570.1 glycosyltransferase family 4 protein [Prevotella communis]